MTIKLTKAETLAGEVGALVGQAGTINKTIDDKCQQIRTLRKGKPIGTVKSGDAIMIRFKEAQEKLNLAEQTIKNNLTTFRKAINEGKAYDVNAIRKAKGSQAGKGKPESKSLRFEAKGEAKADDIVKKLRELFNKLKAKDETAELASFLLDGLDEYEGK